MTSHRQATTLTSIDQPRPGVKSALWIGGKMVPIPPLFWNVAQCQADGRLTRADEEYLWLLLGRRGRCPKRLSDRLYLWRPDLEARMPHIFKPKEDA